MGANETNKQNQSVDYKKDIHKVNLRFQSTFVSMLYALTAFIKWDYTRKVPKATFNPGEWVLLTPFLVMSKWF